MKRCSGCKLEKPTSDFGVDGGRRDGLNPYCNPCKKARADKYRSENREKLADSQRAARQRNPAAFAEYQTRCRNKNRAKFRERYRLFVEKNREAVTARFAKYRAENSEKRKAYNAKHYLENKARYRAKDSARRAKELRATPAWLNPFQLAQIQEFYEISIARRVQTGIRHDVDHIVPLAGKTVCGLHVPWNLQVIPSIDNKIKGNRISEELG